ncbi:MAG: tagaturonate epimerase family protein [Chloroflexota bacterium]
MAVAILDILKSDNLAPALSTEDASEVSRTLEGVSGLDVYPRSIVVIGRTLFFLGKDGQREKHVGMLSTRVATFKKFETEPDVVKVEGKDVKYGTVPANAATLATLRTILPYLVAQPLGLKKSAGTGDRLGLATVGHIHAFRSSPNKLMPILAQQSIRENARTGRTPQQVMDDATWGVFEEGWRDGFGADADHLKTTKDVDVCAEAGFTFFTIDPGDHVDDEANTASVADLKKKVKALPWKVLDIKEADFMKTLVDKKIDLKSVNGPLSITMSEEDVLRAAAKYGKAVAHTATMYKHMQEAMKDQPFEVEMSVDETATVTSLTEHIYIASELKRLKIKVVSLAPRYVGTFEKGVDYIGDVNDFAKSFSDHMAVAKKYGPYKLSLHSGSDKFSIYPVASRIAGDLLHLKTAGTSYLEALRTIAKVNPGFFRHIMDFAGDCYPADRAGYHVSADEELIPATFVMADISLPNVLDDFHAREVLHVTFGSVLNHPTFRRTFFNTLETHQHVYTDMIEEHFRKHFDLFS